MRTALLVVAALSLLPACKVKEGRAPAKIPAGISIPVTVQGGNTATLDSAWLAAHAPDFQDGEDHRAWKVGALAPAAEAPGAVVEVESEGAPTLELRTGESAVAVVTLNKNGELVVKLLDPKEPFPAFHGRGGNRGRGGEGERVRAVRAIRVKTRGASSRTLTIEVEGREALTWSDADLAKLPAIPFTGKGGGSASGWSLRDLARAAGGEGARVDRVTGAQGPVGIDEMAWKDPARTPLLRVNARGDLKLDWAAAGERTDGPEARGITAVHVLPAG